MRNKWMIFLVLVVVLFGTALPAKAVKYGQPDNGEHPFVGLIVFYNSAGVPQWRCTGALIAPRVVLTAAHCTELEGPARIWFDEDVRTVPGYPLSGGNSYSGKAYKSPWWTGALVLPNTGDVGVVVLDSTTNIPGPYPVLAPDGYLNGLGKQRGQQDISFKVVGYGLQSVKPVEIAQRVRLKATVKLVNLNSSLTDGYNLHTSNNPGQGQGPGGTCFGDSGGPIFHDGNKIVAVNSFVLNANCAGASFGYRTDRTEVINWVNSFIQ